MRCLLPEKILLVQKPVFFGELDAHGFEHLGHAHRHVSRGGHEGRVEGYVVDTAAGYESGYFNTTRPSCPAREFAETVPAEPEPEFAVELSPEPVVTEPAPGPPVA